MRISDWSSDVCSSDLPMAGAGIADLITDATRAIFLESPGSLTFEVHDVPAITAIARDRGIATLIDNTWATPWFFPALSHGVAIRILACTKYTFGQIGRAQCRERRCM